MKDTLIKAAIAAVAMTACGAAWAQTAAPAGDAAVGHKLFMDDGCYQCHGTVGQGSRGTGPHLMPALPFEAFAAQLRHPANIMPPYTALVVNDGQLADIYAYVLSLPGPVDPKEAAILEH